MISRRRITQILIFIAALLVIIVLFIWFQISSLKPDYAASIYMTGISSEVTVQLDSAGIPHLSAQNEPDLMKAFGYWTASERLWQMEMMRRAGRGQLSQIFGDTTLAVDKLFLTLGLDSLASKLYQNASDISKNWMNWYAEGVNGFIRKSGKNLPIEFQLLRFSPEPWLPEDAFIIHRVMAWILNYSWKTDFLYWMLQQQLPPQKFKSVLPEWKGYPTIIAPRAEDIAALRSLLKIDERFRELFDLPAAGWGSNSWVVDGSLTTKGKPILANDPHLELTLPSLWFPVVLNCPDFAVLGYSIPGAPGIVIGRNKAIAWGLTNGMVDDSDYYIEQIDSATATYLFEDKRLNLKTRTNVIHSKNRSVNFKTLRTHHGPLFNQIFTSFTVPRGLSLKWTALELSDEIKTFYLLARAQNWGDFLTAIENFHSPAQNFLYADSAGNIGYHLAGVVPIRNTGTGLFPFDGTRQSSEWKQPIPFDKLPTEFNPARRWIVTANNKIADPYPFYISSVWEPPFRAKRIMQLLTTHSDKFSRADMQQFQMDTKSLLAEEVLPHLMPYIEKQNRDSEAEDAETIRLVLSNWDFRMGRESVAASIYEVWQWFLIKNIFQDEMGTDLFNLFVSIPNFYQRIFHQVILRAQSPWYDDVSTSDRLESRADVVQKSLSDAINFLKKNYGDGVHEWEWGKIHRLELRHSLGSVFLLKSLLNRGPYTLPGNGTTVNVATYNFTNPYWVVAGPSLRQVVDFADPGDMWGVIPGGASGNVFSPFYSNQIENWLSGNLTRIGLQKLERPMFEAKMGPPQK